MCSKVNHYTHYNMLCSCLQTHQKKALTLSNHTARETWSRPESKLHKNYLELKVIFLALNEFQDLCETNIVLIATGNITVVAYINKEGGVNVWSSVCPSVENNDLVYQQTGYSQSLTHSMSVERVSTQAIHARPDYSNRVVSPSRGLPGDMQKVASDRPFATRFNNNSLCHHCRTPRPGQSMHSVHHGRTWTHMPSHQQPSLAKWWISYRTTIAGKSF